MSGGSGGDGDGGSRLYRSVATGLLVSGPYASSSAGVVPVIPGASLGVPALESSGLASVKAASDGGADLSAAQNGPLLGGQKFKFERLNLTISQIEHSEHGAGLCVILGRSRCVCSCCFLSSRRARRARWFRPDHSSPSSHQHVLARENCAAAILSANPWTDLAAML